MSLGRTSVILRLLLFLRARLLFESDSHFILSSTLLNGFVMIDRDRSSPLMIVRLYLFLGAT